MAYSNADKQQRYRQRLSARGLVHVQGWVTPKQAEVIRRIMAERGWEAHEGTQGRKRKTGACFSQNPA